MSSEEENISNSKKILVVEDDDFLQQLLGKKLRDEGFNVKEVNNGKNALKILEEETFDLILLDLILPEIGGFEVLEKIKENPEKKDIPIVILSNLGQKEEINKGMDLGAQDYMIKAHYTPQEIVEKARSVLEEE